MYLPRISFTDVKGHLFFYEVAKIAVLQPTDLPLLLEEGWDLTLFTCTVGSRAKVTVRRVAADPPQL